MFQWKMEDDQYIASFRCEPPLKKELIQKDGRMSVQEFMRYLEENGKVKIDIECHSCKRVKPKSNDELSTYEVSSSDTCGFKPREGEGPKTILGSTTPTTMEKCKHVSFVMRLKYQEEDNIVVPGRPLLMLNKSIRVPANTLVKL